ncbi:hypothetical protein [Advenella sp. FME57]|uniref:hypothetical protein n=1 Tax=Advenella sp. FME57 TaxID=2742604 RepID=UPI001868D80B|nr:hypothetical protein [Advenella sp. FME57]
MNILKRVLTKKSVVFTIMLIVIGTAFLPFVNNVWPSVNPYFPFYADLGKYGAFGDYFSGVLGTGLALITVILLWATYSAQKEELDEQKRIISTQTNTIERQAFEQTFFAWISVIRSFPDDIRTERLYNAVVGDLGGKHRVLTQFAHVNKDEQNFNTQWPKYIEDFIKDIPDSYTIFKKHNNISEWSDVIIQNIIEILRLIYKDGTYPKTLDDQRIYSRILSVQFYKKHKYLIGFELLNMDDLDRKMIIDSGFLDFREKQQLLVAIEKYLNNKLEANELIEVWKA